MSQELKSLAGVVEADVLFDDKLAKVRYRPDQVSPAQMVEALDATGFDAELIETPEGDE